MQPVIRPYCPLDRDTVLSLFSAGTQEHIWPCFQMNMQRPLYLSITLALSLAGFHLGSVTGAVLFPGVWMGLVYYSGHEVFAGYVRIYIQKDMRDIPRNYLSRPDDCFFVAETEFNGLVQVVGTVAVLCHENGIGKHGELCRLVVSPSCRRTGLGLRLVQTVIEFCKERGFSKVVLETTTPQLSALSLYKKMGFNHVPSNIDLGSPLWIEILSNVKALKMEKQLKSG